MSRVRRIPVGLTKCPRCRCALEVCVDRITGEILGSADEVTEMMRFLGYPVSLEDAQERASVIGDSSFWLRHSRLSVWETVRRTFDGLRGNESPGVDGHCRLCRKSFRRVSSLLPLETPPGASLRGVGSTMCFDPVSIVEIVVEGAIDGATFADLKAHLGTMFTARTILDKYVRAYLERAIARGRIDSSIERDGTARYRRIAPAYREG